jgi:hypothetical protein
MEWKRRKSRSKKGGKELYTIIIIERASRHGVNAMPWPSTDSEMKGGDNGDNGGEYGDCEVLLLVRVKKERLEEPNSSNGKMGRKKNQIVQTMNQQRKKSIIIITIVRIGDEERILILLLFDFLPSSQRKFLSSNFHTSKDKKTFRHSNIFF